MSRLLTLPEVAEFFQVSQCTIYRLLKYHKLPFAFKLPSCGEWRFWLDGLNTWRFEQETIARPRINKRKPLISELN